jgi:hypothetical protein
MPKRGELFGVNDGAEATIARDFGSVIVVAMFPSDFRRPSCGCLRTAKLSGAKYSCSRLYGSGAVTCSMIREGCQTVSCDGCSSFSTFCVEDGCLKELTAAV